MKVTKHHNLYVKHIEADTAQGLEDKINDWLNGYNDGENPLGLIIEQTQYSTTYRGHIASYSVLIYYRTSLKTRK